MAVVNGESPLETIIQLVMETGRIAVNRTPEFISDVECLIETQVGH